MNKATKLRIMCVAVAAMLSGCATNEQGNLVVDPNKFNEIVAGALTPQQPAPVAVVEPAPVVVEEAYEPVPTDVYVAAASDGDVVLIGGSTYIWVVDANGRRERHLYAHGDHRADVFHRRDELHSVMAHHDGHLPDHLIAENHGAEHGLADRSGFSHGAPLASGAGGAHGMPPSAGAHAPGGPGVRPVAAAKPAPAAAKPASKDSKKT